MQVIHPNKKTAGVTDGPFVDMSLRLMRSTLPLAYDLATVGLSLVGAGGCENLSIKPNLALRRRWKRIK